MSSARLLHKAESPVWEASCGAVDGAWPTGRRDPGTANCWAMPQTRPPGYGFLGDPNAPLTTGGSNNSGQELGPGRIMARCRARGAASSRTAESLPRWPYLTHSGVPCRKFATTSPLAFSVRCGLSPSIAGARMDVRVGGSSVPLS